MIHQLFGFVIWYPLRSDFDIEQFCCATGALGDVQKTTIKIIDKDMCLAVDLWISAVFWRMMDFTHEVPHAAGCYVNGSDMPLHRWILKSKIPPKRMVKPFFTFTTSLLEMDLLQRFPSGSLIALITLSSDPDSQLCQNDDVWMAVLTRITCTNLGTKNTQAGWPVESSPEVSNTESWHSVLRPWAWSSWSARKIGWRCPGWDL